MGEIKRKEQSLGGTPPLFGNETNSGPSLKNPGGWNALGIPWNRNKVPASPSINDEV